MSGAFSSGRRAAYRGVLYVLLAAGSVWIPAASAPAQSSPRVGSTTAAADAPAQPEAVVREAPDSPRAAMRQFLEAAKREDFTSAARHLSLDARNAARGPELARRLYDVIRRRVVIDLDSISPLSVGDTTDGEPPLQDRVGRMLGANGAETHPIVLRRVTWQGERRWLIANQSVNALDSAYTSLTRSWAEGSLPAPLLGQGPFGLERWQWVGIVVAFPIVWLITLVIAFGLRKAAEVVVRRTPATWDDELIVRMRGPLRLFLASILALPALLLLELDASTTATIWRLLRGITIVSVFWMLLRLIDVAQDSLARKAWASDRTNAQTIVPLIGRSLRVALGLLALLVAISQFGYPVGTLLAGLGLGGIVVALAAQKTVENLFGSVTLAADHVFRVGDFVKFEDVQGTVERIGLRSTHVRTPDRTVVKVPNGRLADMRIESFGERDRIRFFTTLRLVYTISASQLRAVIQQVDTLLRSHPRVWPDGISVRFVGIGQYSLDVNVNAWFGTTDWGEFELIRQNLLLSIMEIVEHAGTRLAMPMQVLRIEGNGAGAQPVTAELPARQ